MPAKIILPLAVTILLIFALLSEQGSGAEIENSESQFILYFEVPIGAQGEVSLSLKRVDLKGENGTVSLKPMIDKLRSSEITGSQLRLVEQEIEPGFYDTLIFYIGDIKALAGSAEISPTADSQGVRVAIDVRIEGGKAEIVFIEWEVKADEYIDGKFRPNFRERKYAYPPAGARVFVSNEGSGNITVIDRFKQKVVDVIKVGAKPRGMISSALNQQLYVACAASSVISAIDMHTGQIIKRATLNFGDEPSRLAISPEESRLYVLNYGSNSMSILNTSTLQEEARVDVGFAATAIVVDRLTGQVYVTSGYEDDLTVYNPLAGTIRESIPVGRPVTEIAINNTGDLLFLAQADQRFLTVRRIGIAETISNLKLCGVAAGLAYNQVTRTLYVAMLDCDEIAIFKPDNELEIGSMSLKASPGLMTLDSEHKRLLVTMPTLNQVAIYNINSRALEVSINVGNRPYQVVTP